MMWGSFGECEKMADLHGLKARAFIRSSIYNRSFRPGWDLILEGGGFYATWSGLIWPGNI